jgi:UDP-GlcNAc:undecaprenyl-phosphate/decaprenyl-phosphate GlcNAc-1-phosphate transferase
MFIGFFLAGAALLGPSGGRSRSFLPVLAVPVLSLLIPIFDTTFVMVLRKLSGRAASQGGRDHTSHRLVALGMSERRAVWMLYGFAVLSGLLALMVRGMAFDISLALIVAFTLLLTFVGVHLAGVKVYDESEVQSARSKPIVAFLVDLSYKRRVFEVLLDVTLIVLSYYAAYALTFGSISGPGQRDEFLRALPISVFVKMATFLAMGVYRGLWRYVGLDDLIVFTKAVIVGSVASVVVLLFAFRFQGFSRTVIVLDMLILLMLLSGSRVAFRLFRKLLPTAGPDGGRRVLIYGAGDAGELVARELINNHAWHYTPIGFADDDPLKKGKIIHGLRVFGGNGAFCSICEQQKVEEVLISSARFSSERLRQIAQDCEKARVTLTRLRIDFETLSDESN